MIFCLYNTTNCFEAVCVERFVCVREKEIESLDVCVLWYLKLCNLLYFAGKIYQYIYLGNVGTA